MTGHGVALHGTMVGEFGDPGRRPALLPGEAHHRATEFAFEPGLHLLVSVHQLPSRACHEPAVVITTLPTARRSATSASASATSASGYTLDTYGRRPPRTSSVS